MAYARIARILPLFCIAFADDAAECSLFSCGGVKGVCNTPLHIYRTQSTSNTHRLYSFHKSKTVVFSKHPENYIGYRKNYVLCRKNYV